TEGLVVLVPAMEKRPAPDPDEPPDEGAEDDQRRDSARQDQLDQIVMRVIHIFRLEKRVRLETPINRVKGAKADPPRRELSDHDHGGREGLRALVINEVRANQMLQRGRT